MASNVNVLSGVGLGVLLMAMIMSIVSLVTDHWTEISKPQSEKRGLIDSSWYGLWKGCNVYMEDDRVMCSLHSVHQGNMAELPDFVDASQAMSILSLLFISFGTLVWTGWMVGCAQRLLSKALKILTSVFCIAAALFQIIGCIVWAARDQDFEKKIMVNPNLNYHLGWSWGLGVLAAVLDLLTLVPVFLAQRKEVENVPA